MEKLERSQHRLQIINTIRNIIATVKIRTQLELIDQLKTRGLDVNQSLVSRLLPAMGIIKSIDTKGEIIYHLPWELSPPTPENTLYTLISKIEHNNNVIVISTSPGAAQVVARMLDYYKDQIDILGTIAGDDIIFVAPRHINKIKEITHTIVKRFLGDQTS